MPDLILKRKKKVTAGPVAESTAADMVTERASTGGADTPSEEEDAVTTRKAAVVVKKVKEPSRKASTVAPDVGVGVSKAMDVTTSKTVTEGSEVVEKKTAAVTAEKTEASAEDMTTASATGKIASIGVEDERPINTTVMRPEGISKRMETTTDLMVESTTEEASTRAPDRISTSAGNASLKEPSVGATDRASKVIEVVNASAVTTRNVTTVAGIVSDVSTVVSKSSVSTTALKSSMSTFSKAASGIVKVASVSSSEEIQVPEFTAAMPTTPMPTPTVTARIPVKLGPRWISNDQPSMFCNQGCYPNLGISKYICVTGYGKDKRRVDPKSCDVSKLPCGEKLYECTKKPCGTWKTNKVLTQCNVTCGYGYQEASFHCQLNGTIIPDVSCLSSKKPKPYQECFTRPCGKIMWLTSKWSECVSATCQGIRSRKVICQDSKGNFIPDAICDRIEGMPSRKENCIKKRCKEDFWYMGDWSECSALCGSGYQRREAVCVRRSNDGRGERFTISANCDRRSRPKRFQECRGIYKSCPKWVSSIAWHTPKPCSENCTSTRRVHCVNGTRIVSSRLCNKSKRPISSRPCKCATSGRVTTFAYVEEANDIRLIKNEFLKKDNIWICPPLKQSVVKENYVWVHVRNQANTILRDKKDRFMEIKRHATNRLRVVLTLKKGNVIPEELTGHYLCYGYNNNQNMWDGQNFHRTVSYYKSRSIRMTKESNVHKTRAGRIVVLNCPLGKKDIIQWKLNGKTLVQAEGEQYREFLKTVGTFSFECENIRTRRRLQAVIHVNVMFYRECDLQPYGCCAQGNIPALSQLHTECSGRKSLPCESARYGCCPQEKIPAIGRLHLACKHRYLHPARCGWDADNLKTGMKKCSEKRMNKGFGQLRYYLDQKYSRCVPVSFNTECIYVRKVPTFATVENCRSHCINVNKTERCKIQHVSLPDYKCPSPGKLFYFDIWKQRCLAVRRGECLLNANRFISSTVCYRECKYPEYTRNATTKCFQPKAEGSCKRRNYADYVFYYDYVDGKCKRTTYSGCQGTTNRFENLRSCELECRNKTSRKALDEICKLPRDFGYCPLTPTRVQRWYYDKKDGFCKEMPYTQCGGNGNNFENQEACYRACGTYKNIDICALRLDKGDCPLSRSPLKLRRYYFDSNSMQCKRFTYTGCGGNPNKFISMTECNKVCTYRTTTAPPVAPRKPKTTNRSLDYDPCDFIQNTGKCEGSSKKGEKTTLSDRWYFSTMTGRCTKMSFQGCQGNPNYFDTRTFCEIKCRRRFRKVPRKCFNRKIVKECSTNDGPFSKFYYNANMGKCLNIRLRYGCMKKYEKKLYDSNSDCESTCKRAPATDEHLSDNCYMTPQMYSMCPEYQKVQRWSYDYKSKMCIAYTTCPYTKYLENSYAKQSDCQRFCMPNYIRDVCVLPKDPGRGSRNTVMYYYDVKTRKCEIFWYNGYLGNKNRFVTSYECKSVCETAMKPTTPLEKPISTNMSQIEPKPEFEIYRNLKATVCSYIFTNADLGSCRSNDDLTLERWYFNGKKCVRFLYSGCGSGPNYFDTRFGCEKICVERRPGIFGTALAAQSVCHLPSYTGKCRTLMIRWYFDAITKKCVYFHGCAGVPNSFSTKEECKQTCHATERFDICRLPKDSGPCNVPMIRWYYDIKRRVCKKFVYSGCHGNANRFVTMLECQNACSRHDICRLESSTGDGSGSGKWEMRFTYNVTAGKCLHFWYSGSGGNANRFKDIKSCIKKCVYPAPPKFPPRNRDQTLTCLQPVWDDIPCPDGPSRKRFYAFYDTKTKKCRLKKYSVCDIDGLSIIGNRFETLDVCKHQCEPAKKVEAVDRRSCDNPKPKVERFCKRWVKKFYFNKKKRECLGYWHGGCKLPEFANAYRSKEVCEKTCLEPELTTLQPYQPWATIHVYYDDSTAPMNSTNDTLMKLGDCPALPEVLLNDSKRCYEECDSDDQCPGNKRCCAATSGSGLTKCDRVSKCLTPDFPNPFGVTPVPLTLSCRTSQYGCCPDGNTTATDKYLSNCTPMAPKILSKKTVDVFGIVRTKLTLICNVSAAPKAEIDWYHENSKIDFKNRASVDRFEKNDYKLIIYPPQLGDTGRWRCVATNNGGSATVNFKLVVYSPASFDLQRSSPEHVILERNSSVTLTCVATGYPKPIVNWYYSRTKGGRRSFVMFNVTTHYVQQVNDDTVGFYFCETDNGVKQDFPSVITHHTIQLAMKVHIKAKILTYPFDGRVTEGSPVRLQCRAMKAPDGTQIRWYHNGRIIRMVTTPYNYQAVVEIEEAKLTDAGRYDCELISKFGDHAHLHRNIHVFLRKKIKVPERCRDITRSCVDLVGSSNLNIQAGIGRYSCKNPLMRKNCCKTCMELGKLKPSEVF